MFIQLRQSEITKALELYIAQQGINLTDKVVNISFTAGRKGAGLIADLDIQLAANDCAVDVPEECHYPGQNGVNSPEPKSEPELTEVIENEPTDVKGSLFGS